ncbi:hypothetical protein I553_10768 [Mycobacterium xenopi 4042]|uniref:Uncharacterized protein n=1 Tax=Mycobacterium xenopi 4042 TaxID=1299334 RepID=X8DBN2_MYCXE|nr:hypothetical protein I553_10768 [Mycobacterium xenopi 4042]
MVAGLGAGGGRRGCLLDGLLEWLKQRGKGAHRCCAADRHPTRRKTGAHRRPGAGDGGRIGFAANPVGALGSDGAPRPVWGAGGSLAAGGRRGSGRRAGRVWVSGRRVGSSSGSGVALGSSMVGSPSWAVRTLAAAVPYRVAVSLTRAWVSVMR